MLRMTISRASEAAQQKRVVKLQSLEAMKSAEKEGVDRSRARPFAPPSNVSAE
jgi:hypothetical protein